MVQVSPKTWAEATGESYPLPPKTATLPDLSIDATVLYRAPGPEREPAERDAVPAMYCHVLAAMSNFQTLLERPGLPSATVFPPNMNKPFP